VSALHVAAATVPMACNPSLSPPDSVITDWTVLTDELVARNSRSDRQARWSTALANCACNRWADVMPEEQYRVRVPRDQPCDDYINASHMRVSATGSQFICAQAPLPGCFARFWTMLVEQSVGVVVMLTNLVERGVRKADRYYPDGVGAAGTRMDLGDGVRVVLLDTCELSSAGSTRRLFAVYTSSSSHKTPHIVTHFHMHDWPDFGVPRRLDEFISLLNYVYIASSTTPNICVHCSAGVGRTGVFVLVYSVFEDTHAGGGGADNGNSGTAAPVATVLRAMRSHREGMVQTLEQYHFATRAIATLRATLRCRRQCRR